MKIKPQTQLNSNQHSNNPSWLRRFGAALLAGTALLLGVSAASAAQTSISDKNPGANTTYLWSAAGTWDSGGIPVSANDLTIVMIARTFRAGWTDDISLTNNTLIIGGSSKDFWGGSGNPTLAFQGVSPALINTNAQGYSFFGVNVKLDVDTLFTSTIGAGATCDLNTSVSGVAALIASNGVAGGNLRLLQNNSFSGGLKLLAGRLILSNAGALGATASTLTIENGTQLESGTANLVLNKANPIKINGDFAFGSTLSLDMGLGGVTLGTTAGITRTITVTNAGVTFALGGNIANGTTANSITKAGPGALTLNGANTYSGATTLSAGTLNINNLSTGGGSITTADGTTLGIIAGNSVASLTNSSLTLGATAAASGLNFNFGANNSAADAAKTTGTLTLNGTVTVNVTGTGLTGPGPIILLSYANLAGAGSFVQGTMPVIPNFTPTLVHDTVNKQLKLVLASTPAVKWAVGNGNWDTSTLSWQLLAGSGPTNYIEPAYVLFDDSASGASPISVNLTAVRSPGSITNNSTKNYTLTSSGLSGTANLIKLGTSTLTLANANTYTGGTTISAGTLQLGDGTTVNGSVTGNIVDNAILAVANPSAQTIAGVISGTGALIKSGAGTLSLTKTNTHLGGTLISAGTLQLGDGATANGALVGNGTNFLGNITNNATLAVANPNTQIISNNISGTGALVKSGAGTLTLAGTNSYSGATTVNDGTLKIFTTNATGAGSYTVAASKTLDITYATGSALRISSLTLAASTLSFNLGTGNPTTAVVTNTGALALSGTVTVNVTGTSLSSGTIVLVAYGSGGAGTFVAGTLPAVAGNSVILVNDTINKQLKLVAAPLQTMVWNVGDGDWDLTTANWTNITSANLLTTYLDNSPVRLDDTAAGNPVVINLPADRSPGNILSTNSAIIYSVSGSAITGPASFTKAGTALTLLGSSNSYSGGTLVKDGILSIVTGSALGNPSGSIVATVTNTGSLNLRQSRLDSTGKFVVISGPGADSTHGALYAEPGASYFVSGAPFVGVQNLRLAGDATIGGPGAFNAGVFAIGISEKGSADGINNIVGNLDGKNFSLTKIGGSQLVLFNTNSTPLSQLVVAEGSVMFERTAIGNPIGATTPIVISNNAYIDTWDLAQPTLPPGVTFSNNITIGAGGGKLRNGVGSYYVSADQDNYRGTVTLNGALTVENTSTYNGLPANVPTWGKITIAGAILGSNNANGVTCSGPLTQYSGTNHTIVFSGTNNYNGPTVLNNFVTLQTTTDNQSGGDYTVNNNSVLDVLPVVGKPYLPTANLTIGTATLTFSRLTSLPTNPVIYATNLIVNGGSTVILPQSIYALGTYPLIKYEGTILGNGIGGLALGGLPRGVTASLVDNTANHTVDLVVTDASGVLWTGNLSTDWDTGITANWSYLASPVTFADGDYVGFNDTATGFVAILTNNVSPANITVNATTNYGFGGAAYSIIGAATLVKTGSGTLTISNANNGYTDGTFLNAGEIDLGNATPLGTGLVTVNGGTLASIGGIRTLANNLAISGNFQAGGQGQNLVVNGNVDLGGATRTITLGNFLTLGGQIANGGLTATTAGGYRELVLTASNTYAGGTIASGGAALRVNNTTGSGTGSGSVTINSGATLWGSGTIAGPVSFNAGSHFIGSSFQVLTLTNSLIIATSGNIPDVALSLSNNVPVGNYTLATYNTNGSSGVFASTPSISGGSFAPSTAATIITSNGLVVLQVTAVSTTPPNFPPGGVNVLPGGGISLVSTGAIGGTYRLWATTNLALTPVTNTWTLINSGTVTSSPFTNIDLTATNYPQRFYLFSTP